MPGDLGTQALRARQVAITVSILALAAISPACTHVAVDEIYIVNSDGGGLTRLTHSGDDVEVGDPDWSPDGGRIAFGCNGDICVVNADGSGMVNLTMTANGDDGYPTWSPDGSMIAYSCQLYLCVMDANGRHQRSVFGDRDLGVAHLDWSPDGSTVAFTGETFTGPLLSPAVHYIYIAPIDGAPGQLPRMLARGQHPSWSPDGSRIAFARGDGAENAEEVWVMDRDGSNQAMLASGANVNDGEPAWSPDGRRIAFSNYQGLSFLDSAVHVIDVDGTGEIVLARAGSYPAPAWSPDGSKIVFAT